MTAIERQDEVRGSNAEGSKTRAQARIRTTCLSVASDACGWVELLEPFRSVDHQFEYLLYWLADVRPTNGSALPLF